MRLSKYERDRIKAYFDPGHFHPDIENRVLDGVIENFAKRLMGDPIFGRSRGVDHWPLVFAISAEDVATRKIFQALDLHPENPFHWRALFETFARKLSLETGRKQEWTAAEQIELAFDVFEVSGSLSPAQRTRTRIAQILLTKQPYRDRYSKNGDAPRKLKADHLRKLVAKALNVIGKGDDGLVNIAKAYPESFEEVYLRRFAATGGAKKAAIRAAR